MYKEALAAILSDVMRRDAVAAADNFFSLGIDSLQAITVAGRIQEELGLDLELIDVLKHPSINELDAFLNEQARTQVETTVTPIDERTAYRTSPVQRGLYLMDRMMRPEDSLTFPQIIEFDAELDPQLAERAFTEVLQRHEPLRTTFALENGEPVQIIGTVESARRGFEYTDTNQLQSLYETAAKKSFDLEAGPLVRFHLVRTSEKLTVAMLSIHHIISDGFSRTTIENEFRHFYDREAGRRVISDGTSQPQTLLFQYKDYVYWLAGWTKSPKGVQSLKYWENALSGYDGTGVFIDGPAAGVSFAAAADDGAIDQVTLAKLQRVTVDYEVTMFVVLQCCIRIFLFLLTGKPDIIVGVAVTIRDSVPLSGQIGPFVNVLPIRTEVSGDSTFKQLVSLVNEATLQAFAHKLLPVETIIEHLHKRAPLFDVGFTLQKQEVSARQQPSSARNNMLSDNLALKLLFIALDSPSGIDLRIRYRMDSFVQQEIVVMRRQLMDVINKVCDKTDDKLTRLFNLTSREHDYAIELDLD